MRPVLKTESYGVRFQGIPVPGESGHAAAIAGLAAAPHETLILESRLLTAADVDLLQAAGKTVLLYVSIAETSHLRAWWDDGWTTGPDDTSALTAAAPAWISDIFSSASGGQARLIRYWEPEWRAALQAELDLLAGLGPDGLFLDNVLAYWEWGDRFPRTDGFESYARQMVALIEHVSAEAAAADPGALVVINGDPYLPGNTGDAAGYGPRLREAISGILQEGVFTSTDPGLVATLKAGFADRGLPVLALDYVGGAAVDPFHRKAVEAGFLPHAGNPDQLLGDLAPALNQPTAGDDVLYVRSGDTIAGGAGADRIEAVPALGGPPADPGPAGGTGLIGGAGPDRLYGGAGPDWALYQGSPAGVRVGLWNDTASGGDAAGDRLFAIEHLGGSAFADVLSGDAGANRFEGGAGPDRLYGGAGPDWALYQGSPAGVRVGLWNDTASGGDAAGDRLFAIEHLGGSAFADVLSGDAGANRFEGGAGPDRLYGGAGPDVLDGGAGNDGLYGGPGPDIFVFGPGSDQDTAFGFEDGTDLIELAGALGFGDLTISAAGGGARVAITADPGTHITLAGLAPADIAAADFI